MTLSIASVLVRKSSRGLPDGVGRELPGKAHYLIEYLKLIEERRD